MKVLAQIAELRLCTLISLRPYVVDQPLPRQSYIFAKPMKILTGISIPFKLCVRRQVSETAHTHKFTVHRQTTFRAQKPLQFWVKTFFWSLPNLQI